MTAKTTRVTSCYSCHITIAQDHIETKAYHVGGHLLCGWCYGTMQTAHKIILNTDIETDKLTVLLPNGKITTYYIN